MASESPECVAGASEARLHFVGDPYATQFMNGVDHRLQIADRIGVHAVGGEDGVGKQCRKLDAMTFHIGNGLAHFASHPVAEFLGGAFRGRLAVNDQTVSVRRGNHAHGQAKRLRGAERWGKLGGECRIAMVGLAGHDHAFAASVGLCYANGQIVGFGTSALEHDAVKFVRHGGEDIFRIMQDVLMQVARVGVEHRSLLGKCIHHARVTVADGCDIVVHVQVFLAVGIPKMRATALHQMHWIAVEQTVGRTKHVTLFG